MSKLANGVNGRVGLQGKTVGAENLMSMFQGLGFFLL